MGRFEPNKSLSDKVAAYVLITMWTSETRINSREFLKARSAAKHVLDIGLVFPRVSKIDLNKILHFEWRRRARVCACGVGPVFWQCGLDDSGLALRMFHWSSASVSASAGCDQRTAVSLALGREGPEVLGAHSHQTWHMYMYWRT